MPEELCLKFIDRYLAEQENLRKEVYNVKGSNKKQRTYP